MQEKKFRIQYDNQEMIFLTASFDDAEWKCLTMYLEYVKELETTAISRNGALSNLTIVINEEGEVNFKTKAPKQIEIAELLHKLRPFILQDEKTFFNKISNILKRKIENKKFRSTIDDNINLFEGKEMSEKLNITSNNLEIISQRALLMWLNSYEYHRDIEKREELNAIFKNLSKEAVEVIFLMLIIEKLKAIKSLACLLSPIVGIEEFSKLTILKPQSHT